MWHNCVISKADVFLEWEGKIPEIGQKWYLFCVKIIYMCRCDCESSCESCEARKVITFSQIFSLISQVAWLGQMNLDLNHNVTSDSNFPGTCPIQMWIWLDFMAICIPISNLIFDGGNYCKKDTEVLIVNQFWVLNWWRLRTYQP